MLEVEWSDVGPVLQVGGWLLQVSLVPSPLVSLENPSSVLCALALKYLYHSETSNFGKLFLAGQGQKLNSHSATKREDSRAYTKIV